MMIAFISQMLFFTHIDFATMGIKHSKCYRAIDWMQAAA
jgi:hypothetical protein